MDLHLTHRDGHKVDATIEAASSQLRSSIERDWRPLLGANDEESVWAFEQLDEPGNLNFSTDVEYALLVADLQVQALLVTSLPTAPRGLVSADLVYIEYYATAPWNRDPERRWKNVGTFMLGWAVRRSRARGHAGRIGLHSKRQSEGAYKRRGLTSLGVDGDIDGQHFFLGDALWAAARYP
ncbi:MAG: hypothetical protein JNL79_01270 [Myxococcales bacterium]|nr:hypothetical protein [Myxococcales bacterium]